jgi:glyoxylase-like metal-dependent hydrolase (beta-lactamase superfamily II)
MRAIAKNIYIEDQFMGVVLGVISLAHGLIQVDAPPSSEDGRSWRASLLSLGSGVDRMLVNLDAHPDRTLGARAMDCTVVAHEKVAQIFRSRSNTFKAQGNETGADWETIGGLGNVRWAPPEITFSEQMTIHWGDVPVLLEHHPGPSTGASWVVAPEEKVVFIGDAVLKNQPPYLASADLPAWLETLKLLLSPAYRGWTIVSGRSGPVAVDVIRAQREHLDHILGKLEKMAAKKSTPDAVENLVAHLLGTFKVPSGRQRQYTHRLRHGLTQYYIRHYHPGVAAGEE